MGKEYLNSGSFGWWNSKTQNTRKYNIYLKPRNQALQSFHFYTIDSRDIGYTSCILAPYKPRRKKTGFSSKLPHLLHLRRIVGKFCFSKASLLSDVNTCVGHSDTGRVKENVCSRLPGSSEQQRSVIWEETDAPEYFVFICSDSCTSSRPGWRRWLVASVIDWRVWRVPTCPIWKRILNVSPFKLLYFFLEQPEQAKASQCSLDSNSPSDAQPLGAVSWSAIVYDTLGQWNGTG